MCVCERVCVCVCVCVTLFVPVFVCTSICVCVHQNCLSPDRDAPWREQARVRIQSSEADDNGFARVNLLITDAKEISIEMILVTDSQYL